ncbi:MAG: serine protease [Treponema sp.]|jgi:serine protease Do|nr:serine protease [Treponema sp.]
MRKFFWGCVFLFLALPAFSQTSLLRDYVGLVNQTFHPDIIDYMEKFRAEFERRGDSATARNIDSFLWGSSGSGFVYIGPDGGNYIITNHHVITQSYSLSVTFEKQDGTKTTYGGLSILAADEDMDIAILAFPKDAKPFSRALAFLDRPVEEGEDVYSAGFPGMGNTTIWQFGRGMVSNANVVFPAEDTTDKMMGPYIQHTAQVDPGNSGGPLLVQTPGVLSGYAIVGINTLSARFRQAANFSIPLDRVRSFLDRVFSGEEIDQRARLEERVYSFIEGMDIPGTVYEHISGFLSNDCVAENAENAIGEVFRRAPRRIAGDISGAFGRYPVDGMAYAVGWTLENTLRSSQGSMSVSVGSISAGANQGYTVTFRVNEGSVSCEWINEYGIWRIRSFGRFMAGDKAYTNQASREKEEEERLRAEPDLQFSAGFAYFVLDAGPAFTADIKGKVSYLEFGLRTYLTGGLSQIEGLAGLYFPVKFGNKFAVTPYGDLGLGFMFKRKLPASTSSFSFNPGMGVSFHGGLMFTSSLVPGLYLQTAYQFNMYHMFDGKPKNDPHIIAVSVGYGIDF